MKGSLSISSFKRKAKQIMICFVALFIAIVVFSRYCAVANPERGTLYGFYHFIEEDTLDVLCVGSSHVYCSIIPVQMYQDYGIAAYDLAVGSQSIPFSYYYLEEAFKTQHPRLVILDTYMMIGEDEQEKDNAQANFLCMKPSVTKYKALKTIDGLENPIDVFLGFPITHNRYADLNEWSFHMEEDYFGLYLGYDFRMNVEPYDLSVIQDVSWVTEIGSVSERKDVYLRKCIELCQENGADIVLTNAPWPDIHVEAQKVYNYVQQIADEYGIEFINGCLYTDAIGLDYTTDSMGELGHLNYMGASKYTRWLAEHLISQGYDLPDRRGDARYDYWQRETNRFENLKAQYDM